MRQALGLKAGDHILDIGGGWGGLARYCGELGVTVTSLTISEDSEAYIRTVLAAHNPRSEVLREDLLDHRAWERYDHVVIFGVIEHIPTYARFCERVWDALKPGGKLYMDASATKEKYAASAFTRRYTWTGAHSCLVLQDMIGELIHHGFHVEQVRNETDDYRLTMRKWAEKLDRPHRARTSCATGASTPTAATGSSSGAGRTASPATACRPTASSPSGARSPACGRARYAEPLPSSLPFANGRVQKSRRQSRVVAARGGRRSHTGGTCVAALARQRQFAAGMRRTCGRVHKPGGPDRVAAAARDPCAERPDHPLLRPHGQQPGRSASSRTPRASPASAARRRRGPGSSAGRAC